MNTAIYDYQVSRQNNPGKFDICHRRFSFEVPHINTNSTITYLADFRCLATNRHLFYCDYYPAIWKNHHDKLNKLLCNETDIRVNFKKITLTCFYIFHEQLVANDSQAVFVISGSLIKGETLLPETGISRKLKLYWEILSPHALKLKYRLVKILDFNAIAYLQETNPMADEVIQKAYANFKTKA